MKKNKNFFNFIRMGSKWDQFGISIDTEDNDSRKPTKYKITIQPNSDFIRYEQIIKLFGKDQWFIKTDWVSILRFYRELFKLYKICIKVNNMKEFL